jgi:hypothetical protein
MDAADGAMTEEVSVRTFPEDVQCGPRTLAWPALGFVRRACDGARMLAALGGLDSSGVAR